MHVKRVDVLNWMGGVACWFLLALALALGGPAALAAEAGMGDDFIPLTRGKPYIHVLHEGRSIRIQRVQDPDYELKGYFAKTARKCPPFCLQPITAAPGVRTIGEVEMFEFMEHELRDGTGVLIDARTPAWHAKGTIPGSINIPFTVFSKSDDDPELRKVLTSLGVRKRGQPGFFEGLLERWGWTHNPYLTDKWDFTQAKKLTLWCNGPECGQSPRAIRALLKHGYPADKLQYYRGGMQLWQLWGLTTVVPGE